MSSMCQNIPSRFLPKKVKLCNAVHSLLSCKTKNVSVLLKKPISLVRRASSCSNSCKPVLNFESGAITQFAVTDEIQFFRDSRNDFKALCYKDTREPYGPPLAILFPWNDLDKDLLKKIIEIYGEKGFDVVTVHLTSEQFLFPCVIGNAMGVVTNLIDYLNETHMHRPYIFHGFSIGVYLFGEMMAQFSDHYESYRTIIDNVRGCLWDSPVDVITVKPLIGKFFYPKNWMKRWQINARVRRHFKNHYHDSVSYWLRSRNSFCNPLIRIPYVFFTSYTDIISNPCCLKCVQNNLECNGIPIYHKTWWDSCHGHHFMRYCYEYTYGMILFFNLANLFPDECGKYQCNHSNASLNNIKLSKTARDNFT